MGGGGMKTLIACTKSGCQKFGPLLCSIRQNSLYADQKFQICKDKIHAAAAVTSGLNYVLYIISHGKISLNSMPFSGSLRALK